jgi:mono/diheme cytochrome c family protein
MAGGGGGLWRRLSQVPLLGLLGLRAWRRHRVRNGVRPADERRAETRTSARPSLFRRHWVPFTAAALMVILLPLGALGFIYLGVYDVAASRQHTAPVYWALITTLRQSVLARASREVGPAPDLAAPGRADEGLILYEANCVPCHGAPGIAMHDIGKGLTPAPANLVIAGRQWSSQEIFWSVKHGFKMTGMPAWGHRLSDEEIWSIVALVKTLPTLSPLEYRERRARLIPSTAPQGEEP